MPKIRFLGYLEVEVPLLEAIPTEAEIGPVFSPHDPQFKQYDVNCLFKLLTMLVSVSCTVQFKHMIRHLVFYIDKDDSIEEIRLKNELDQLNDCIIKL